MTSIFPDACCPRFYASCPFGSCWTSKGRQHRKLACLDPKTFDKVETFSNPYANFLYINELAFSPRGSESHSLSDMSSQSKASPSPGISKSSYKHCRHSSILKVLKLRPMLDFELSRNQRQRMSVFLGK